MRPSVKWVVPWQAVEKRILKPLADARGSESAFESTSAGTKSENYETKPIPFSDTFERSRCALGRGRRASGARKRTGSYLEDTMRGKRSKT
jgi:hypothetical protein